MKISKGGPHGNKGAKRSDLSLRNSLRKVHGMEKTSTYTIWKNMKSRCCNPKNKDYKNYGKRGISICERWNSFVNFLEDMGVRPEGLQIDRINNNGNYSKEN